MKHEVVRTPIDTLNILGAGGLKRGSIVHVYGAPGSGKSTFCYQTCSMDMMDNEDSVLDIIDVENSADVIRLVTGFHLDMDRVNIHHMSTLEEAFKLILDSAELITNQKLRAIKEGKKVTKLASKEKLLKMEDKEFFDYCSSFKATVPPSIEGGVNYDIIPISPKDYDGDRSRMMKALARAGGYYIKEGVPPRNIIWDTIAVSRPQAEFEKIAEGNMDKNAAGMNVAAQVVSTKLSACLSKMGGKPLTLFLPNQMRNKAKKFGPPGFEEGFAGSWALEHNSHYILKFRKVQNKESREANYDEDEKIKTGTDFVMSIEKTKFCPATKDVKLYINDKKGGVIIAKEELAHVAADIGILVCPSTKGWFTVKGREEEVGNLRFKEISGNPKIRNILMEEVIRHYRTCYGTLDVLYNRVGKGDFGKPLSVVDEEEKKDEDFFELQNVNPFA